MTRATDATLPTPGAAGEVDAWGTMLDTAVKAYRVEIQRIISVKDFGCAGDDATDDTANFQAALDAADSNADGVGNNYAVYVPPGIYLVGALTIKPGTKIFGDHHRYAELKCKSGTSGTWIQDNGNATRICMEDLYLNCNDQDVDGLDLGNNATQHGGGGHLKDVWIIDAGRWCLKLNSNAGKYWGVWTTDGDDGNAYLSGASCQFYDCQTYHTEGQTCVGWQFVGSRAKVYGFYAEGDSPTPLKISSSYNQIYGYELSIGANITVDQAILIDAGKANNTIYGVTVNTTKAAAVLTNFVDDQQMAYTKAWSAVQQNTGYRQNKEWMLCGESQTYTPSNVVADRTFDANSTSIAELADVLGTLIDDLQGIGILE